MKLNFLITGVLWALVAMPGAAVAQADNLILVTIDGLRWQEVFRGLDPALAGNEEYSERADYLNAHWGRNAAGQAPALMPFVNGTLLRQGSVIGDRDAGSCAAVTNPWYFSYPGYNEILTGYGDPGIDSNDPVPNPNVTFLEWLRDTDARYADSVQAFASWNVFPDIFNTARSHIPVNVGKLADPRNAFERTLNRLHDDIPSPWPTVRLDAFTHHYALSAMTIDHPRLLYIGYGETDDFAHDGEYDQYVLAANRTDRYLQELWNAVQADPFYRDSTVLFVTVDHGRGHAPLETWQHHASKRSLAGYMQGLAQYADGIVGSDAVWMAAIGPGIRRGGMLATGDDCIGSNRIAATLLDLLGVDYRAFSDKAGAPIAGMLERP